ncbi:MAG TPA: hypothetical protein DCQ98_05815 [Planctomycetaceae bacterium]|nr:hypothetical protein [Planctomycetaceae bacterium]
MLRPSLATSLLIVALAATFASAQQRPNWAPAPPPLADRLVAWYDAPSLVAALAERGIEIGPSGEAAAWPDASGNGRDLAAEPSEAAPRLISEDAYRALRFDGERTAFRRDDSLTLSAGTVFVVGTWFGNGGGFRGAMALSRADANDYVSGFNYDLGPVGSTQFDTINVEGAGFGGARDLFDGTLPFGRQTRVAVDLGSGEQGVSVRVDGRLTGTRPRDAVPISLERIVLGARWYDNAGPPRVQGHGECDLAAVLIYDRVLDAAEHAAVDAYLTERFGKGVTVELPRASDGRIPLVTVADPPRIQVLQPGFRTEKLPLELTNINNLVYRHDGRLMALGYDGRLWWLDDTDCDGLEDRATLYFDGRSTFRGPIGLAIAPKDFAHGAGVFVPSKGKLSFVVDTDGDDIADQERIVASGWQEITQSVDTLGVDVDPRDGSVWFGLGTGDYTNAYRVGSDAAAAYELASDRGTIQRLAPNLIDREIVATGIRFPVGLRFSPEGDAFVTDQEGATWLPNGNPFDELLVIERGRHYGFPPRHPRHLPNVIDEPSLFDYGPQHQSTCGLNFDLPVRPGDPIFGPERWRGDLFVAGYSRGKVYRTRIVKSGTGMVAGNDLFACTDMLPADVVVSPRGDLLVALHSGGPDWGSGPTGNGEIWRIVDERHETARPVAAWASSPTEVQVAFDRPLGLEQTERLAERIAIEFGPFVAAGDRFETLRPGYQVVADQLRRPRFPLPVRSVQLTADRRTLILAVDAQRHQAGHAVSIEGLGRPERIGSAKESQFPETDLAYTLHGVEATWSDAGGVERWRGWLPHLDPQIALRLTAGSAAHERLAELLREPGTLRLETRLDLTDLLRPAVQPGAAIDYEWPVETARIVFVSNRAGLVRVDERAADRRDGSLGTVELEMKPGQTDASVEIVIETGGESLELAVGWSTAEDPTVRPWPLNRMSPDWVIPEPPTEPSDGRVAADHPLLAGGNWERGQRLFRSETLGCAKCHRFDRVGGAIGPDLSNLPYRDPESIVRDIVTPSFAINPDHLTQAVETVDGGSFVGAVRSVDGRWVIGTAEGKEIVVEPSDVASITPVPTSIMPEGLIDKVRSSEPTAIADLLVYLTTVGPRMPEYGPLPVPPPIPRAEVDRVMAGGEPTTERRPLHILLVDGEKDHGLGEHDYPAWQAMWRRWLAQAEGVTVDVARDWPSAEQWSQADTVVLFQHGTWNDERARDVDRHFRRGGGLMLLHWAVDGGGDPEGFAERIGLAVRSTEIRYRHGPLSLDFAPGSEHPIARNLTKVDWYDESYWMLVGDRTKIAEIAVGEEEGAARPLFWTLEPQGGRVFVSILGHYAWTFDDPLFRIVALRGLAWSAGEPVDRFMPIVESGARIAD